VPVAARQGRRCERHGVATRRNWQASLPWLQASVPAFSSR